MAMAGPAAKVVKIELDEEELKRTKKLMDELELKRLVREERLNRDVSDKKDALTEKQQKVVHALYNENVNLKNNLTVMQTERRCIIDVQQAKEIADLFGQGDTLDQEIAVEKQHIAELMDQIHKLDKQNKIGKKTDVRIDTGADEMKRRERLQESLKSRLHAEQVQLSVAIQENAELRKKIDLQLKDKSHFNQMFETLIQKLNKGKIIMKDVVEESQATFKKRDEVTRKIQALKEKDAADLRKRQEEMQDLEMKYTEDKAVNSYKRKVMMSRVKLSESVRATKKANNQQQAQEQYLREMTKTLDIVKRDSGLEDVQDICDMITRQDAENFSLFNYNNEIRYQLEAMTEQTIALMRKVDEEQENKFQWEEEQERKKSALENRLDHLEDETSDVREQTNASYRTFERLLSKLRALYDMIECDPGPVQQLLGDNTEVTDFNHRLYMDMVESRLMELMNVWTAGAPDLTTFFSKLSNFTFVPQRSAVVPAIVDKRVLTKACPDCSDAKLKGRTNTASVISR